MMKIKLTILALSFSVLTFAGNDDKRGQAGATELLMNPYANSSSWIGGSMAGIGGPEAMRFNVAGIAQTNTTAVTLANTQWYKGSGISSLVLGLNQRVGTDGVLGISLMSLNFGDFIETTTDLPEGTGITFKPQFFNMGIAYAKKFSKRINGGVLVRVVSESVSNVTATGVAVDAGIQYKKDRFKFGVALRNVGSKMQYAGDGLTYRGSVSTGFQFNQSVQMRSEKFEMPSLLHISASYDFISTKSQVLTLGGNFNSNSYTSDMLQVGGQWAFNEKFFIRAGFDYYNGMFSEARTNINSGPTAGFGIKTPFGSTSAGSTDKEEEQRSDVAIDYSFRTDYMGGTHAIGLTVNF